MAEGLFERLLRKSRERRANTPAVRLTKALAWVDARMELWRNVEDQAKKDGNKQVQIGALARLSELADVRNKLV